MALAQNQRARKPRMFTPVFRLGESGNRVEKRVTGVLNHVLTQANRGGEGGGVLCWRDGMEVDRFAKAEVSK